MATETTPSKSHARSVLKIYFLLMTLVGVIGSLITMGILLYTVGKKVLITNDEYIMAERSYEMDACATNPIAKPTPTNANNYVQPTQTQIDKCKTDKKVELIKARKAVFKTDVLGAGIRAVLFLILMGIHYPKFMKANKKD
jgi:hypothetical protein